MSFNNIIRTIIKECIVNKVCNGGVFMHLAERTEMPCTSIIAFVRGKIDLKEGELIRLQKEIINFGE